mmetsp:Transcript_124846/g.353366  ORF Transcript_124846/g.353366 Transcript_124846/m.353366 type:complete len:244 (+) Transcript_124846:91-822(+)
MAKVIKSRYPTIQEHETHSSEIRATLAGLRGENAALEEAMRQVARRTSGHSEQARLAGMALEELGGRATYLRIATIANPAPIGQYSPNLRGPTPHGFYEESVAKLRSRTLSDLSAEASRFSASQANRPSASTAPVHRSLGDVAAAPPVTQPCRIPANFSCFSGDTQSALRRMPESVLMGLRSPTHTRGSRRPGRTPQVLQTGPHGNTFTGHTASMMAKSGQSVLARRREHISAMTRTVSSPSL